MDNKLDTHTSFKNCEENYYEIPMIMVSQSTDYLLVKEFLLVYRLVVDELPPWAPVGNSYPTGSHPPSTTTMHLTSPLTTTYLSITIPSLWNTTVLVRLLIIPILPNLVISSGVTQQLLYIHLPVVPSLPFILLMPFPLTHISPLLATNYLSTTGTY